jgi:hypothetical protein
MNKRIEVLKAQIVTYEKDMDGSMEPSDYGRWVDYDDLDKFAELIVKECINEIHVADVGNLQGKGYYLDKVAEHIEKYFGVE